MKNHVPKTAKLQDNKAVAKKGRGTSYRTVNVSPGTCSVKRMDNKAITFTSNPIGEEPFGQFQRWSKKEMMFKDVPRPVVVEE